MAFSQRRDLGTRIGGEKGQFWDEFITRSQPQPGRNITFEYASNWDIIIHALSNGGGSTCCKRMIEGEIQLDQYHNDMFGADGPIVAVDDNVNGVATDRRYYGTAVFRDIVHNWNLSNKRAFLVTLIDVRNIEGSPVYKSEPKVVGLDVNTLRIYGTKISTLIDVPNGFNLTCTLNSTTTIVPSATTNLRIGMRVVGTGVPDDTFIINIVGGDVTLSKTCTSSGTPILTFYAWLHPNIDTRTGLLGGGGLVSNDYPKYHYTIQEYA